MRICQERFGSILAHVFIQGTAISLLFFSKVGERGCVLSESWGRVLFGPDLSCLEHLLDSSTASAEWTYLIGKSFMCFIFHYTTICFAHCESRLRSFSCRRSIEILRNYSFTTFYQHQISG